MSIAHAASPRGAIARKRERLEARVSPEQKALMQRAADLQGRTLSEFLISSAQSAAEQAILTHDVMKLTGEASRVFAETILNPSPPNERLRTAFERHE